MSKWVPGKYYSTVNKKGTKHIYQCISVEKGMVIASLFDIISPIDSLFDEETGEHLGDVCNVTGERLPAVKGLLLKEEIPEPTYDTFIGGGK